MGPAEQSPRRRGPSPTPTRSHGGQVVLVLKGDLRVAERLVHLKLLALGHRARVVAVHSLHVF